MSKGKGRLYTSGERYEDGVGQHSFTVRVPDGYRVTYINVMPVEDQPIGDTEVLAAIATTDTLPAVTFGSYFNAAWIRFRNLVTGNRGVYYQVFFEPVDGSDVQVQV
jgi:hypothetical protein